MNRPPEGHVGQSHFACLRWEWGGDGFFLRLDGFELSASGGLFVVAAHHGSGGLWCDGGGAVYLLPLQC